MGCCCSDLPIVNDLAPVPPPVCALRLQQYTIAKWGYAEHADVSASNDTAWSSFVAAAWQLTLPGFTAGAGFTKFSYQAGVHWSASAPGMPRGSAYLEQRAVVAVSLNDGPAGAGGVQRSIRELYGLSEVSLLFTGRLFGNGTTGPLILPVGPDESNTYTQAWSAVDVWWGLASSPYPWHSGGLLDVATASLASGVTVPGSDVELFAIEASQFAVDISDLVDETGDDWLLLLLKVPDAAIVKITPTVSAPGQSNRLGPSYPGVFTAGGYAVSPDSMTLLPVEIWGCIKSVTLEVDFAADSSDLEDETRTRTCGYHSGQNLTKRFRGIDNSVGQGASVDSEWLDLNSNVTTVWTVFDHSGLDKSTLYPAIPTATTAMAYTGPDDNEEQINGVASPTVAFLDGTITVEVYAYNSADDKAAETVQASIKLGGSFVADQPLSWGNSEAGWRSAVLATGRSIADFTGAELRLTSPTVGLAGGKTFEQIRVRISGDTATSSIVINRRYDVYLTESSGDYYLTFDVYRAADPNDSDWYLEATFTDTVALGDTGRETIGDLIGTAIAFSHEGDDNDTPANGTEDATVTFTITDIAV